MDPGDRRGNGALRAVFLDAGGTLIHLDWGFLAAALARVGIARTRPELERAFDGARRRVGRLLTERPGSSEAERASTLWSAMLEGCGCADPRLAADVAAEVRGRDAEGRLWAHVEPGTVDALRALRARGLTVGVVSNSDGRVATFLEAAGLSMHLDFIVDSGRVGIEKPDPRIFHVACAQAGIGPAAAVHVGDVHAIDVVGARAAGVRPILLAAAATDGDDCLRIASLTELPARLSSPDLSA
ncbi:MAG TPA: HAD-IA family hydrolase [Longimicrobiales bacterium]|nr:HAD-IA family hydrolase [Longimicrobiales bacterium]